MIEEASVADLLKPADQSDRRKKADRVGGLGDEVPLGSWHWLRVTSEEKDGTPDKEGKHERLVCVTGLGSNYAKLSTPEGTYWRIHLQDRFPDVTRPCPNPREVIERGVKGAQAEVSRIMAQIQEEVARIGMTPGPAAEETGTALAVLSGQADPDDYKKALVKAKNETLPRLFKEIETQSHVMKTWMKAELLPIQAHADVAKSCIGQIEGRIFNVEIYAGISEKVTVVREGDHCQDASEKLRVFQAMSYCDEECLLDYRAGGMDFSNLPQFDRWLAKPENANRILPFPRCLVAMRVRRHAKDKGSVPDLSPWIAFEEKQFDEKTFLFVRNGEAIYRIDSKMEFGHLIFPSRGEFSGEPLMFSEKDAHGFREDKIRFRTVREHEDRLEKEAERERLSAEWVRANPVAPLERAERRRQHLAWKTERTKKRAERAQKRADARANPVGEQEVWNSKAEEWETEKYDRVASTHENQADHRPWHDFSFDGYTTRYQWERRNPHRREDGDLSGWTPFTKDSVHYDEALAALDAKTREWNRVTVVIQGIFDRSEILHPHPPVHLWRDGFEKAIEPIYDGEHVLHAGEAPDFEAYRQKLNESLGPGSWTIGQQRPWLRREQAKEQRRRNNDSRLSHNDSVVKEWWTPSGDPGPGFLAKIADWRPNAREGIYRWERERKRRRSIYEKRKDQPPMNASITVSEKHLFNASAYQPGDYLPFFRDPRTRQDYLKWAPFLLTAEDWRAGKYKPKNSRALDGLGVGPLDQAAEEDEDEEDDS